MPRHTSITEARRRLFDLVDWVLDRPDGVVYIEHRDRKDRVVLVREDHLASLERYARAVGAVPTMVGSVRITNNETVADVVAMGRAESRRTTVRRLKDFGVGGGGEPSHSDG